MQLKDKVALVTGAGSGIGKAIALRFAREGAHVVLNYRPGGKHSGEDARVEVLPHDPTALAIAANVDNRSEIELMIRQVVRQFGALDIAVCNAGIEIHKPFLEVTDEEWSKVVSVNLYGSFVVSQIAARQMVRQGRGGKLIFISSVHEDIPFPGFTPYCVSKGGIRMLMRNLAIELAEHKINVNNIAPGAIDTPINETVSRDPKERERALQEIPWRRFGTPDEIASLALFLASPESDYATGSTYFMDGGLTQQVTRY